MDSTMYMLIDMILTGFGIYTLNTRSLLIKTGELRENVLLPKTMTMKRCKNPDGFREFMKSKLLVFGTWTTVCGVLGLVNDLSGVFGAFYLLISAAFLVAVWWFCRQLKTAAREYFGMK